MGARGKLSGALPKLGRRVALRSTLGVVAANLGGAVFTFAFLSYLAPVERTAEEHGVAVDVAIFAGYFIVSVLVIGRVIDVVVRRATGWVMEDRAPTEVEQVRTLGLARRIALLCFLPWLGGAVFFSTLNALMGHTFAGIVITAGGIVDGGLVTCTLSFLLLERFMRPVVAAALAGSAPPERASGGVRTRLVLTWLLGSAVPLVALATMAAVSGEEDIRVPVIVLSGAGLVAGLLITIGITKNVGEPLSSVRVALEKVREGRLDVSVPVDRSGDLGLLQAGVNDMVAGLRERHRLAELFGRHVGVEVAAQALERGSGLEGSQREASALFVDIIGSTAMAEVLPPSEVVATLNAYFGCVVRVVGDEGGWVNKFEGDGALCVFGAPADQPDHAARALRAARRLHAELEELRPAHPGLDAAIGVSSGTVVAGNVGTESRYEYTIIGAPVNEAARLTDLAKERESRVLASAAAVDRAGSEAERWRGLGTVALRGKARPTEMFEPVEVRQPEPVATTD